MASIAHAVSAKNRARKWLLFNSFFKASEVRRILDVGYADKEWSPSDNYLEKHWPHPNRIIALGVETPTAFTATYPLVRPVRYGGGVFPFLDGSFDICWSNAVLEHVGDFEAQVQFLSELKRVGKAGFITTPNRYFPIEVHTRTPILHYLPKRAFDAYLRSIGKGWAAGAYMRLLSRRNLEQCLQAAGINSYRILANRWFGFTLDFVVVWSD